MKGPESPISLRLSSMPRTRCDPGEGPLWCLVMGGPSAKLYHAALLQAMKLQAKGQQ